MTRAEKIEAAARALSRVLGEVATTDPTVRWNMKSAVALSDAQRDLTAALASPSVEEGPRPLENEEADALVAPLFSTLQTTPEEREEFRRRILPSPREPDAPSPEAHASGTCPHFRCATRDGNPWRCLDCQAIHINGKWAGGRGTKEGGKP